MKFVRPVAGLLVLAVAGMWAWRLLNPPDAGPPPPRVEVEAAPVAGVTFEFEFRPASDDYRAVWGAESVTAHRGPEFLDFADDLLVVNGTGFPTPARGDVVRWNLTGPLLVNGAPVAASPVQPRKLEAAGTDLRWAIRGRADTPRDSLSVGWSRAGRVLVAANGDGVVRVWDGATPEVRTFLTPDAPADGRRGWGLRTALSPDGKTVATANLQADGVTLWDAATGNRLATLPNPPGKVTAVHFVSNDWLLEARGTALTARHLAGDRGRTAALGAVHAGFPPPFALSADGKTLARNDGATVAVARLAVGPDAITAADTGAVIDKETDAGYVAVSPDGGLVAVFDGDARLALHDAATGKVARRLRWRRLPTEAVAVGAMAFFPDGRTLAVGAADGVRLYDVATGRERGWVPAPGVRALAFSGDGATLAAGLRHDSGLRVWEVAALK